jgi:hypothetical protein
MNSHCRRFVLLAGAALALAGCVQSRAVAGAPRSADGGPITTWTWDDPRGEDRRIMMRNDSGAPVRVTALQLGSCINIREVCDSAIPVDVVLPPGETREVFRVRPDRLTRPFSYRYTYVWAPAR